MVASGVRGFCVNSLWGHRIEKLQQWQELQRVIKKSQAPAKSGLFFCRFVQTEST